ncbi:MAG TPA: hypothetical protein PKL73_04995 [Polyangiaceae bacterium]|jgi:hypothetical protein|nr:MAG: hypothetical protein BWY17_00827 [Deltaproteobacteria bacterium ADurb.Bin207]HNS96288.1 hypothetical protein [Polyangiaceae bacterium]HNZ20704.1 hypothetical protein [Polyangiaceae bacterium]HOD20680.1 hypothetical protein [Polyangiaceae bacterium]HOE47099.1 hypothetical protein [Polyangiaceae bacterium]
MSRLVWLVPLWCISLLGGCSSDEGFDLERSTDAPGEVSVTASSVTLPQGVAVGVRLRLHRSEDPENGEFTTAMRSTNPQIVQVWPTTERNTFVLCGASEGVASVTVLVEAQDDRTIAVVVDPPLRVTP